MDFQSSIFQMRYLITNPRKVYRLNSWRHQTKQRWSRDDPTFTILVCIFIIILSVSNHLVWYSRDLFKLMIFIIRNLLLFIISGILFSTVTWLIANIYICKEELLTKQRVEWLYSFDIHCNSYWVLSFFLYIMQLLFFSFLTSKSFISTLLSNILFGFSFSYYIYICFLGYLYLPFLNKKLVTYMLYPIIPIFLAFSFMTIFNINFCYLFLK